MDEGVRRSPAPGMNSGWVSRLWGRDGGRLLAGDAAVVSLLLALTLMLFYWTRADDRVQENVLVEVSNRQILSLNIGIDDVQKVAGPLGQTRFEIRGRRVRVLSSPCPLKICQRAGWIEEAGEMLVCLPNQVVIKITGRPGDSLDAVSR